MKGNSATKIRSAEVRGAEGRYHEVKFTISGWGRKKGTQSTQGKLSHRQRARLVQLAAGLKNRFPTPNGGTHIILSAKKIR